MKNEDTNRNLPDDNAMRPFYLGKTENLAIDMVSKLFKLDLYIEAREIGDDLCVLRTLPKPPSRTCQLPGKRSRKQRHVLQLRWKTSSQLHDVQSRTMHRYLWLGHHRREALPFFFGLFAFFRPHFVRPCRYAIVFDQSPVLPSAPSLGVPDNSYFRRCDVGSPLRFLHMIFPTVFARLFRHPGLVPVCSLLTLHISCLLKFVSYSLCVYLPEFPWLRFHAFPST